MRSNCIKIEMQTSGVGGLSVISDTPGLGGGREDQKGQIFADVFYGWPLTPPHVVVVVVDDKRPSLSLS